MKAKQGWDNFPKWTGSSSNDKKLKDISQKKYSMAGIKGPTLFLSSLSVRMVFKFVMYKENRLN